MTGIELIAQERQRQIRNSESVNFDMNWAAMRIAAARASRIMNINSTDDIEELVKAGAMVAAEIDRLQAIEGKEND